MNDELLYVVVSPDRKFRWYWTGSNYAGTGWSSLVINAHVYPSRAAAERGKGSAIRKGEHKGYIWGKIEVWPLEYLERCLAREYPNSSDTPGLLRKKYRAKLAAKLPKPACTVLKGAV